MGGHRLGRVRDLGRPRTRFFYAQRTADGRVALGGRAVPYRFASRIDRDGAVGQGTVDYLTSVLRTVLPQTREVPIAHAWCGVLAVPRDWSAGVSFDRAPPGWARPAATWARGDGDQPRRPDPGRPCSRPVNRGDRPAVGRSPIPHLGTRTVALVGCARNVHRLQIRRSAGSERTVRHVAHRCHCRPDCPETLNYQAALSVSHETNGYLPGPVSLAHTLAPAPARPRRPDASRLMATAPSGARACKPAAR